LTLTKDSKFTIARVIARLNVGGPAIQAILMTESFESRGFRALLLTGHVAPGENSMEYLARDLGVEPIRIATMSRRISLVDDLVSLWRLVRIFRRERPTVVHTHTAKAGALGRIAAMITGAPVRVHTFHGHVFEGYFSPLLTRVFVAIERFLARHSDCIVAISNSQRNDLVEVYRIAPPEKVVVLPLGLDLEKFERHVPTRGGVIRSSRPDMATGPIIGWVGRLTSIKRPEMLVDIAAIVHDSQPTARFVLVGDGDSRAALQTRIAESQLDTVVELLGCRQDMPSIYADLDVVLLTSRNEGTPVALLEAMASGKPFVSTDVGGVRDLVVGASRKHADGFEIFDNGILAPADPLVLARAVQFLTSHPDICSAMGTTGRASVSRRFSHVRLADDLECLYRDLACGKVPTPSLQAQVAQQR